MKINALLALVISSTTLFSTTTKIEAPLEQKLYDSVMRGRLEFFRSRASTSTGAGAGFLHTEEGSDYYSTGLDLMKLKFFSLCLAISKMRTFCVF